MTLTGTGNVAGDYTLTAASVVNTPSTAPLAGKLVLTVEDIVGRHDALGRHGLGPPRHDGSS